MITKNEVKYIQSLAHQKSRNETGCFLAEGVRLVNDLLKSCSGQITAIYCLEDYGNQLNASGQNIPITIVSDTELSRISQRQTPNQVLAIVRQFHFELPAKINKEWILALDGIQDPGNMGTMIRLADWFGIKHILCSMDCVDVYNPKVIQASMGGVARVGVHYAELNKVLPIYEVPLIGAMMNGDSLESFKFPDSGVIVIGNEGKGIRQEVAAVLTHEVTIPSFGGVESLNAAMATGIIFWELRRT